MFVRCSWPVILTIALLLASCAASGPVFQQIRDVPPNKGLLYIYRPYSIVGAAVDWPIEVDGKYVGDVSNGSYFPLTLDLGLHVINAGTSDSGLLAPKRGTPIDINIDSGGSYDVRVVFVRFVGLTVQGVDEQAALPEIASLHLP